MTQHRAFRSFFDVRHIKLILSLLIVVIIAGTLSSQNAFAATVPAPETGSPGSSSQFTAVAIGHVHNCALTGAGGIKCWGWNDFGQLGDGTWDWSPTTPVDVIGLSSGVTTIVAGNGYSCALSTAGAVKCWGLNALGELGDGTTLDRSVPMNVFGLSAGVTAISAVDGHTCALTTAGGVKCWGENILGEVGDGTTVGRSTPADVIGLGSGVSAIAAGRDDTCALTSAGGVKCWGSNLYGELGDGTTVSHTAPVNVYGLSGGVAALAAGSIHNCVLTTAGGVKCWGYNQNGEVGDGTTVNRSTPADVIGLSSGVSAIAVGSDHTCALTIAGGVKCWG